MAAQISRSFRDISLSFARNPVTNDILALRNEDAIKKAVINLVKTQIGERFFNSLLGTSTNSLLFELNTIEVSSVLEEQITRRHEIR
jgi:phage baseplate assembly protein W